MAANEEALQAVPDVGPVVAQNIAAFFRQPHNREIIARLLAAGVHWTTEKRQQEGIESLAGLSFVLTEPRRGEASLGIPGSAGQWQRFHKTTPDQSLLKLRSWGCA